MKMYILIRSSVPDNFAPLIAAHASLACYKAFEDDPDMQAWIGSVFRKVVCTVNDKEFETAKTFDRSVVLTESALDDQEVCIAFCPRQEWPKPFQFYSMWKPAGDTHGN